ncbi:MAG: hypothetical protein QOE03_1685 [Micromonosporaceae bacterium]|nr:hypothetical protein [Micromonosporaceae bacterium]
MSKNANNRVTGKDRDLMLLQAEAWIHDGVVPVPFLGATWQERRGAYWRRRIGAAALMFFMTLFVGAIAAGFALGIAGGVGHGTAGIIAAVAYSLTAVPGFLLGRRKVARAPLDDRGAVPSMAMPVGCLAFVVTPFVVGLSLAVLLSMFGRDFIGERRAREITAGMRRPSSCQPGARYPGSAARQ